MTHGEFYEVVLKLCEIHGASQTSGYRTGHRNQMVGGHPHSRHMDGYAFDLVPDDHSQEARRALVMAAQDAGLAALDEGDHVHVQTRRPRGGSI